MVQLTPKESFSLELNLYQSTNVQLYEHNVMNSDRPTPWRNNDIRQIYLSHYELWNSKVQFQFFTSSS